MLNGPLSPWPSFSNEEAEAVAEVIRSNRVNYWTGEIGRAFEREFAAWVGTERAVAVANGTLALDLALKALGIGPGDAVIVTPRTFIASISSVVNAGATPIFADVDRDSGNISAATISRVLDERVKAIIPVHLGGWPCDMDAIMALADANGCKVIEDCAQAHGARVGDRSVGSIGQIGAWSFCQDKIMTTGGEGGMVTTNDERLWSSMWSFKDHGKSWDAVYNREHPAGFRWLHESFGTNWRMLEVQAAIGRLQLRLVDDWVARRAAIAAQIMAVLDRFADIVRTPRPAADLKHAYYRLYAYVKPEELGRGWDRDRIVSEINALGVPVFHGTCSEAYLEKAFDDTSYRPAQRLPNALELGETSLMFLTHPTLTDSEVERVGNAVATILERARP